MMVRPSREEARSESIRRVQVGVAGLGGVMLLVGLTNVLVANIRKDGVDVAAGTVPLNAAAAQSTEPLADLGVAPASGPQAAPSVPDLQPDPKLRTRMDRDPRQDQ